MDNCYSSTPLKQSSQSSFFNYLNPWKNMCGEVYNFLPWKSNHSTDLGVKSNCSMSEDGKGYLNLHFDHNSAPDHGWTAQDRLSPAVVTHTEVSFDGGGCNPITYGWHTGLVSANFGYIPSLAATAYHKNFKSAGFSSNPPAMASEVLWQQQPGLWENFSDFCYEDYVCRQTEPARYSAEKSPGERSAYRLAADTLAKSNLNPNAEIFTPKSVERLKGESEQGTESAEAADSVTHTESRLQSTSKDTENCEASIKVEFSSSPRPFLDRR